MNPSWRLTTRPRGSAGEANFTWVEEALPETAEGQVLVRHALLSLDPTNRIWMEDVDSYLPKLALGSVMRGIGIGVVEESKNAAFAVGDVVLGMLGWQAFCLSDGSGLSKLPKLPVPVEAHFGLLGHIGLTAYFGLIDVGKPKAGETLVVSAAAGAVGSLVGQIGKILGLHVVGIAGSAEKCRWLTEELGFDAAINYKEENVAAGLRRTCPDGIDIDFENVGGEILEAVLGRINLKARVVLCGLISQYNATGPLAGPANLGRLLTQRGRMEGFIVTDYLPRMMEAMPKLLEWHAAGKLKYRVDMVEGLRNAPAALGKLFDGTNAGKLLVRVSGAE